MQGMKRKAALNSLSKKIKRNQQGSDSVSLPLIPDKCYFTIGEVANLCGIKPHVLRYWEQEFSQINPMKRRSNRRYYRHKDVLLIRHIRKLLYEDGFTIEGARAQLELSPIEITKPVESKVVVEKIIAELENVLQKLKEDSIESVNISLAEL